jgi:hypothetical protein
MSNITNTKKQGVGKIRFRSISRTTTPVRLLNGDKSHIEKMVKELKGLDGNFANQIAAVRHYVHIGIAAETASTDLRNSLGNTIVKNQLKIPLGVSFHFIRIISKNCKIGLKI